MDLIALHALLVIVLVPAAVAKLGHARADRNRLEVLAVCVAVTCMTGALTLDLVRKLELDLPLTPRFLQVLTTLLAVGGYAALQLFYLAFVARYLRRYRIWIEASLIAGVVAAAIGVAVAVPGTARIVPGPDASAISFDVVTLGYIFYTLLTQLTWTFRYARRFVDPVFRSAAWTAAGGVFILATCMAVVLGHILSAALLSDGLGGPYRQFPIHFLIHLGTVVLVIGLTLPSVVTQLFRSRRYWSDLRIYRELRPLWTAIAGSLPEIVRPPRRHGHRARLVDRSVLSTKLQLRLAQCRDGYSLLSPYLADAVEPPPEAVPLRTLVATMRDAGCPPLTDDADDLAVLRAASSALRDRGANYRVPAASGAPVMSSASASSANDRSRHSAP